MDGLELARALNRSIMRLYGAHLSEDGTAVDYAALRGDALFAEYKSASAQLRSATPLCARTRVCVCVWGGGLARWHCHVVVTLPAAHGRTLQAPLSAAPGSERAQGDSRGRLLRARGGKCGDRS